MELYNGSTTHRITISEPPNRAFRFLLGCAILYAVWRCRDLIADFFTFRILNAFDASPTAMESTTVTGTVLPLLIEFLIGLGGVGIFVFSLGWSVVVDLFAGAVATVAAFRARITSASIGTVAATAAAQVAATTAAAIGAGTAAANAASSPVAYPGGPRIGSVPLTNPELVEFARLVQNTFREQRAELKQLTAAIEALETLVTADKREPATHPKRTRAKRTTNGGQ